MHEEIGYQNVERSETLQMTRRIEAAHHLLAYPCWPVRVFCPVVKPLMLAWSIAQTQIPLRRRVAFGLVGDQHKRRTAVLPEQLAHEARGG